MGKLGAFLIEVFAYLAVLPFLVFAIVWFSIYRWRRDRKLATTRAIDITMFFLIGVVAGLLDQLFGISFGSVWIILFIMIIGIGLIGNAQQRLKGKVNMIRAVKVVWRLGFIVLSLLYLILMPIGIIIYSMY